jgi:hypothetical protein
MTDAIAEVLEPLYKNNTENTRVKATSTCKEDSDEGNVQVDRTLLANLIKMAAPKGLTYWDPNKEEFRELGKSDVAEIKGHIGYVAKRYGIDRVAILARKAAHAALQQSQPAEPPGEPGGNTQLPTDHGEPEPGQSSGNLES